jgi:hypothetical protein
MLDKDSKMFRNLLLIAMLTAPVGLYADYRDNPKWQEYQSRRDARKAAARSRLAEIRSGRNYSWTPLSYRSNVNVAMPHGHLYKNPPVMWWNRRRPALIIIR